MTYLGQTFNSSNLPESTGFDPIPAGWYQAKIKAAELKSTNTGSGEYIAVQYEILGPSHQGRVVFGNLNIRNQSAKAEEIGLQMLNALISSIGLSSISDTDELLNHETQIKVSVRPAQGNYEASNDIKGFKAIESGMMSTIGSKTGPAAMTTQQTETQTAQSNDSAPPWRR